MRLYTESAPRELRRAYTAIINDLSNAESSPSIERRALSAELIATSSAPSPRSAETNERTPKGHRASAERRAPSLHRNHKRQNERQRDLEVMKK
jgi:hypothetical protein